MSILFSTEPAILPHTLHYTDFFGGEVVEVVNEVVDLRFEGLDVGGGIGLFGGEGAVNERFDLLLLSINQPHTYLSSLPSRFANARLSRLELRALF